MFPFHNIQEGYNMKKPWSISTTVRNPERIREFLKVLKMPRPIYFQMIPWRKKYLDLLAYDIKDSY